MTQKITIISEGDQTSGGYNVEIKVKEDADLIDEIRLMPGEQTDIYLWGDRRIEIFEGKFNEPTTKPKPE